MTSPVAATIDATGISAPTYADILSYLVARYQAIFGVDAYIGNDSADGQLLALFALSLSDANSSVIASYNSFRPGYAQGVGLSSIVKINGLLRLVPTASSATLTIVGVAGTTITNGQAKDANGNLWNLPTTVTIPNSGTIDVTAFCSVLGSVAAAANSITQIQTPTYGWQTVNNTASAALGTAVESDAALRVRQAQSVGLPSVTIFDGIWASIEAVPGVTRVQGYENNTGATDGNGVPAHSLEFVVEGGNATAIAMAIAQKIPPGIGTAGATSTVITDSFGSTRTIKFAPVTQDTIGVNITISAGPNWNATTMKPLIAAAVSAYISALAIGEDVAFTKLYVPAYALLQQYPGAYEITAMTINKNGGSFAAADIAIAFDHAAYSVAANVTITP